MRRRRRKSTRPRKRTLHGVLRPAEGELYPRCAGCDYSLEGLPESRCPECGREFDTANPATFELTPPYRFWRYWCPGLMLGAGIVATFGAIFWLIGSLLAGVILGLPVAIAAALGYGTRGETSLTIGLTLPAVGALASMALTGEVDGVWQVGAAAGVLLALPCAAGFLLGIGLRRRLKRSPFTQRWHLP